MSKQTAAAQPDRHAQPPDEVLSTVFVALTFMHDVFGSARLDVQALATAAAGRSAFCRSPPSKSAGAAGGWHHAHPDEAMSASSGACTPRGKTMTGQCASATTRRETPPSRTARTGP